MKQTTIRQDLWTSLKLMGKSLHYVAYSVASDILFFVIFGMVFVAIQTRLLQYVNNLVVMLENDVSSLSQLLVDKTLAAELFLNQPDFAYNLSEAFRWLTILLVAVYLIWGFFQGFAWMSCMKIIDRGWDREFTYILRFFVTSLVWMSLFYAFVYTWIKQSVLASLSMFPSISQDFITGLFTSSSLAMCYFAIASFALMKNTNINNTLQKTILFGISKYARLVPRFFIAVVLVMLAVIGGLFAARAEFIFFLGYLGFVALPLLTYLRVFIAVTVLEKN
jgi:hypothetical protein